jgi:hypothetical protein
MVYWELIVKQTIKSLIDLNRHTYTHTKERCRDFVFYNNFRMSIQSKFMQGYNLILSASVIFKTGKETYCSYQSIKDCLVKRSITFTFFLGSLLSIRKKQVTSKCKFYVCL